MDRSRKCSIPYGEKQAQENNKRRKKYTQETLALAVEASWNPSIGVRDAAKAFGVPASTISNHREPAANRPTKHLTYTPLPVHRNRPGSEPILGKEVEDALAVTAEQWHRRHMSISKNQLLSLVLKVAAAQRNNHPIVKKWLLCGRPSEKWFKNFIKRYPSMGSLVPDRLCSARDSLKDAEFLAFYDSLQNAHTQRPIPAAGPESMFYGGEINGSDDGKEQEKEHNQEEVGGRKTAAQIAREAKEAEKAERMAEQRAVEMAGQLLPDSVMMLVASQAARQAMPRHDPVRRNAVLRFLEKKRKKQQAGKP